jgi:hypothetical protein
MYRKREFIVISFRVLPGVWEEFTPYSSYPVKRRKRFTTQVSPGPSGLGV